MKILFQRITILIVAFFLASAIRGATFSGTLPGFGSRTNAEAYAVQKANGVNVLISMLNNDGNIVGVQSLPKSIRTPFASKQILDDFIHEKLDLTIQKVLTNSSIDKSRQFFFDIFVMRPNAREDGPVDVLVQAGSFKFTRLANGSYQAPVFSEFATVLPPKITVDVKADWVRVEETDETGEIYPIIDTRWNLTDGGLNTVSLQDGYIELDTNLVISGTNGPTRTTVSLIVPQGTNQVFHFLGPMGTPISEIPVTIGMSSNEGQLNLVVSGGNVGRRLQLESTDTLGGVWRPEGDVKPGGYPPSTYFFSIEPSCNRIFRVRSVNGMPIGGEAAQRR